MKTLLFIILMLISVIPANAVVMEEKLANPIQEEEAREIFRQLRCVVCSGETIADSRADIAGDLRKLVRERVKEGEDGRQIIGYIVSRYGDAVLMSPPVREDTYFLWFGPAVMVFLGGAVLFFVFRQKK